jgi:hypothetical protein
VSSAGIFHRTEKVEPSAKKFATFPIKDFFKQQNEFGEIVFEDAPLIY